MKILVTFWRKCLPIKILRNEVRAGDIFRINKKDYFVVLADKKQLRAYCVKCTTSNLVGEWEGNKFIYDKNQQIW